MADADPDSTHTSPVQADEVPADRPEPARSGDLRPAWLPWLAWGWVALLVLTAVAELGDWDDLRLALDFQRHFR